MLKIRRPLGRLIFNMGIAIPGKTVFLIETAPRGGFLRIHLWTLLFYWLHNTPHEHMVLPLYFVEAGVIALRHLSFRSGSLPDDTTPLHGHSLPLQWRHNGRSGVWNHQHRDCLLNRLFGRRSKKTSKLRVTGLCAGISAVTGEFPARMASNAENVSIWLWQYACRPLGTKVRISIKIGL